MNKDNLPHIEESLLKEIRHLLEGARRHVYRVANSVMVQTNWHIGKMIVEAQGGEERAAYGDGLLRKISKQLTAEYGKGFTLTNLKYMRQFYLYFPKGHTLCDKLSWSHYRLLLKVSNPKARAYYAEEAAVAPWSVRQLERQINTQYYERLLSTHRDETEVRNAIKDAVVRYTLGDRKDIGVFQAKYDLVLPTAEELQREIERTREQFLLLNGKDE